MTNEKLCQSKWPIFGGFLWFPNFYPQPEDSIGPIVGWSKYFEYFWKSSFSALGLDRDLGFSRGPPPGTWVIGEFWGDKREFIQFTKILSVLIGTRGFTM